MRDFIKKYFTEKGVEYKETGNEQFVLKRCQSCGDDKFHHFYMNANEGLWDCKRCNSSGNFNQFRRFFGDTDIDLSAFERDTKQKVKKKEYKALNYQIPLQYASRLWATGKAFQKYLMEGRQLSKDLLEKFKIGSTGTEISIPIYENDILVNIRYRRDPTQDENPNAGPKYTQEKGCKPALFNGDVLKEPLKVAYVCEGELDAMQLVQRGLRNVVGVTLGAGYFPDDWVSKFADIQQVYFVYDSDEAGRSGAKKAAEKLGVERCKLVELPTKEDRKKTDVTNYFVDDRYTKTDFMELVKKARPIRTVGEDSIKHISEFNEKLRDILLQGEHLGELTGYGKLDEYMGGMRKGRLIIVSGLTNTGKSSFAVNICLNIAVKKIPAFYFSLEMPPIDIVKKLLMLRAKLTNDVLKEIEDPSETLTAIDKTLTEFKDLPIYLYNGSGVVKYKILAECARIVKEEYGCQAIFIDHLHYFAQNYGNLAAETSQVVRNIKQLAIELDIPIILLAHLNRGGRTKQRKGMYIPNLADLKETSTIEQDADQVLFVCRDSESEERDDREKAFIKIAKNRDGQAGRSVSMKFDESITTFIEQDEGVDYEQEVKHEKKQMDSELTLNDLPF